VRYLSVCSGIEAATVAWHPLGWRPVAFSEIEPFPSAVLAHHYPDVPNYGDMTKFKEWPDEPVDLLVGGTPCQSFSVAGLRKGLADPRGNLALVYLGIVDRFRPKWVVWENVPGVLSSSGGRDFGAFLGGLGELGYGWAYRVLDAQYCRTRRFPRAVPQRRRRVFVVGYIGDWRPPAAVLLEPESLRGNPPPRRQAGQGVAAGPALGFDVCGTLSDGAHNGGGLNGQDAYSGRIIPAAQQSLDAETETLVAFNARQDPSHYDGTSGPIDTDQGTNAVASASGVRRLTPTECERLQAFQGGYTRVPYRGKPASDGPRYKALGNSMAVNVMDWLGQRIALVDGLLPSRHVLPAHMEDRT
jgi:DNA (cytosine-5)-methyltransferase 1